MTVKEYIEKNKSLPDELQAVLLEQTDIWTNEACKGYLIKAMENCGKSIGEVYQVLSGLKNAFDTYSVEEAEQAWRDFN